MKSQSNIDELAISDAIKAGNITSLKELYNRYAFSLLGIIDLMAPDEQDQIEILNATFIKISRCIDECNLHQHTMFVWLIQNALDEAANYLQKDPEKTKVEFWGAFIALKERYNEKSINSQTT